MSTEIFVPYKVVAKQDECEGICSLSLQVIGASSSEFTGGQHLVLRKFDIAGHAQLRSYSISNSSSDKLLRISVKRELAPSEREDCAAGFFSNWLHDEVAVGDVIEASAPRGDFVLQQCSRDIVMMSCGVGITPLLSILHQLKDDIARKIYFIYICNNSEQHPFIDEVLKLAEVNVQLKVHFCYKRPTDEDHVKQVFDSHGVFDRQRLQQLLPLADYRVYLCGPQPFMRDAWDSLCYLGVKQTQIHYEFFGAGEALTNRNAKGAIQEITAADLEGSGQSASENYRINFSQSALELSWDTDSASILDFAESNKIDVEYSCRSGICNACATVMSQGSVSYDEPPLVEPEPGQVLLCCAKPTSNITLEL